MKTLETTMIRTGSHWVAEEKEEVFGYFESVWQGKTVMVTMSADKYQYASKNWSDWRVYACESRYINEDSSGRRGPDTTDTARRRLSETLAPVMLEWLKGSGYLASRSSAVLACIMRPFNSNERAYNAVRNAHNLLARFEHEMSESHIAYVNAVCDAFAAYEAVKEAGPL